MHRIAVSLVTSTVVSLLVLAGGGACGGAKDETKAEAKADAGKAPAAKAPEAKEAKIVAPLPAAEPAPAPAVEPAPAPKADDYGQELCATIIPCFQKLEFAGSFSADVTVDIEPDGSVSAVSFTGQAPTPVQTCITDAIKAITLADYNGKPGRTRCIKSGQLMGGTQMIMSDSTYELRDAGKAEADTGKVAPAPGKADAKADTKAD